MDNIICVTVLVAVFLVY